MKSPIDRGGLRFYLVIFALITVYVAPSGVLPRSILYGGPLVLLGVALHLWAKGCLHQDREVTATGPYRFVRHPFYTANALVDAGIAVMSGWRPWAVFLPLWWFLVYIPVIRGEEAYLTGQFGEKYTEYKRRISMLFPLGKPLPRTGPGFTWRNRNIASGREIPRCLRLVAYIPLFLVAAGVRLERGAFLTANHGLYLAALPAFVALHAAASIIAWRVKHGQPLLDVQEAAPAGAAGTAGCADEKGAS